MRRIMIGDRVSTEDPEGRPMRGTVRQARYGDNGGTAEVEWDGGPRSWIQQSALTCLPITGHVRLAFRDKETASRFMGQYIVGIADQHGRDVDVFGTNPPGRWERLREIAKAHGGVEQHGDWKSA